MRNESKDSVKRPARKEDIREIYYASSLWKKPLKPGNPTDLQERRLELYIDLEKTIKQGIKQAFSMLKKNPNILKMGILLGQLPNASIQSVITKCNTVLLDSKTVPLPVRLMATLCSGDSIQALNGTLNPDMDSRFLCVKDEWSCPTEWDAQGVLLFIVAPVCLGLFLLCICRRLCQECKELLCCERSSSPPVYCRF